MSGALWVILGGLGAAAGALAVESWHRRRELRRAQERARKQLFKDWEED